MGTEALPQQQALRVLPCGTAGLLMVHAQAARGPWGHRHPRLPHQPGGCFTPTSQPPQVLTSPKPVSSLGRPSTGIHRKHQGACESPRQESHTLSCVSLGDVKRGFSFAKTQTAPFGFKFTSERWLT